MALKLLLLRKKLQDEEEKRNELRNELSELEKREGEIATAINEAKTEEDKAAVEEFVSDVDEQVSNTKDALVKIDEVIVGLVSEIDALQAEAEIAGTGNKENPDPETDPQTEPAPAERSVRSAQKTNMRGANTMNSDFISRSKMFTSRSAMENFYKREDVKKFLGNVRSFCGSITRGVNGGTLGIPDTVLEVLRDNVHKYSVLMPFVNKKTVKGTARQNVIGDVPEGIWMEMAGALDELEFKITQIETDGYKVGGFIPIHNYLLDDSDINLGEEIMYMLGQAIGLALDKAILYGKGSGSKMPVGFITRLAEQSQPAYWGSNQGTWTDLHSSNILTLNIGSNTGANFFQPLVAALAKAKRRHSATAGRVWVMNELTHIDIMSRAAAFDMGGALVSQLGDTMPLIGGQIVECEEMADYEIAGGYLSDYNLIERQGGVIESSKDVFFLQDATAFKGTARYDGKPVRGEAFVLVSYDNSAPTTTKTFKTHYADSDMNVLVCTAAAGGTTGKTVVTVSGAKAESPTLKYGLKIGYALKVGDALPATGWTSLTSGTTNIEAAAGTPITVVELDGNSKVVSLGTVLSVPKT